MRSLTFIGTAGLALLCSTWSCDCGNDAEPIEDKDAARVVVPVDGGTTDTAVGRDTATGIDTAPPTDAARPDTARPDTATGVDTSTPTDANTGADTVQPTDAATGQGLPALRIEIDLSDTAEDMFVDWVDPAGSVCEEWGAPEVCDLAPFGSFSISGDAYGNADPNWLEVTGAQPNVGVYSAEVYGDTACDQGDTCNVDAVRIYVNGALARTIGGITVGSGRQWLCFPAAGNSWGVDAIHWGTGGCTQPDGGILLDAGQLPDATTAGDAVGTDLMGADATAATDAASGGPMPTLRVEIDQANISSGYAVDWRDPAGQTCDEWDSDRVCDFSPFGLFSITGDEWGRADPNRLEVAGALPNYGIYTAEVYGIAGCDSDTPCVIDEVRIYLDGALVRTIEEEQEMYGLRQYLCMPAAGATWDVESFYWSGSECGQPDGGIWPDAGTIADAAPAVDTAPPVDAGPPPDAWQPAQLPPLRVEFDQDSFSKEIYVDWMSPADQECEEWDDDEVCDWGIFGTISISGDDYGRADPNWAVISGAEPTTGMYRADVYAFCEDNESCLVDEVRIYVDGARVRTIEEEWEIGWNTYYLCMPAAGESWDVENFRWTSMRCETGDAG